MKIRIINNVIAILFAVTATGFYSGAAYAACPAGNTSKGQVLQGSASAGGDCSDAAVSNVTATAINILSYIVGIAAVIVVVLSGLRYILSNGDSNKIGSAKNTLIYALVGVAVAALAQFLVHFVLNQAAQ